MSPRPPALGRALLRLLPLPHRDFVSGDLEEEYTETVLPQRGKVRADLWFLGQALRSLASFAPPNRGLDGSKRPLPPLLREARYAARGLARRPGFSAVAVVTLAVGIGTATSVFSVADAVLFRTVPGVERPEELAMVRFAGAEGGGEAPVSLPNLRDLGAASPGVADIAGFSRARLQVSADGLAARTAWSQIVTGAYFEILGVRAARGRLFSRLEADAADGPALVVMSDAFWRSAFQADPGVVGRTLRINGLPFTVVGIAPPEFRGVERLDSLELWVPASQHVALRHGTGIPGWELEGRGAAHFENTLIRLSPGASPEETQRQLRAAMARLVEAFPEANAVYADAVPTVDAGIGLSPRDRARMDPIIEILAGLAVVILLVTCANVANLLVLRGVRRREETSLRRALGAARSHLVVQNLSEALLIALPAALLGLAVAVGVNDVLGRAGLLAEGVTRRATIDARVFGFATALGVLTAVTFGLLPALLHAGADQRGMLEGTRGASGRVATVLQGGLSTVQLGLSLALVSGVLLLARTSANLTGIDPGFSPEQVLSIEVNPGPQGYRGEEVDRFRATLLEQLAGLSGVEAVSASGFPPFGHLVMQLEVRDPGDPDRMLPSRADWVTDGFFRTLDIPILAGRPFTAGEATAVHGESRPVVLSRSLAERLYGTPERAVGRSVDATVFGRPMPAHVVGVAEDVIDSDLRRGPSPKTYVSMPGSPQSFTTLLVRTRRPMDAVAADVRSILAGVDPNIPLGSVTTLSQQVANATVRERSFARLAALLAAIAILLAGVGLYSVVAYAAAQRRREFGIRMAVGASGLGITRLVLGHALAFGMGGVVLGIALSVMGGKLLSGMLFGVAPHDPLSLGMAAVALLAVTVAASLAPARGATRVDPAVTLRAE